MKSKSLSPEYDALGRRTAKIANFKITRYLWDGNVLLHEWTYGIERRPLLQMVGELGELFYEKEPVDDVITWVYDEGCYTPIAKLINGERYSIVSDYIGRPVQCFDDNGEMVWETDYDVYGRLKKLNGEKHFIPFRQMGQYEDAELGGLYYNRFRYYDSGSGVYISQDPIGLAGNNPNLYAFVKDSNSWIDIFGLAVTKTVDFTGHPDLYPGPGKNIVTIKLTGDRSSDFTRAYKEAGINRMDAIDEYTWHHAADFNPKTGTSSMQLVKTTTHEASFPHKGSAGQFKDHFGIPYDTYEAKVKAFEQGWRSEPKKAPKKIKCG
ncbi:MAG: hypothetical protein E6Q66_10540 [Pedobacter sp.]|nr:MAG: hypothetical protein E6Q66_10540 [Pedobacter sp.]